jgi:hypothetical protein
MNRTHSVLLSLLILAVILLCASCGGSTVQLDNQDARGVTQDGFSLLRYDDQGQASTAMDGTLDMQVQPGNGTTVVQIAIDDNTPAWGVTLDLQYDPTRFSPAAVEFDGLIDSPLELAVTSRGGLVALGQVSTDGAEARTGQFATVTFRNEPFRSTSAPLDAHNVPLDVDYNVNGVDVNAFNLSDTDGTDGVDFTIYGLFAIGDGNQDGISNISDLTPMGALFQQAVTPTDLIAARADYNHDGLVTVNDLTPLGARFGEVTSAIEILVGDSATGLGDANVVQTLTWASGTAPAGTPSTTTADPSDVWRTWTGTLSAAELGNVDTAGDGDGTVFVSARTINAANDTAGPVFDGIAVTVGGGDFTVATVTLQIEGATGGTGANNDIFGDGSTAELEANEEVTLRVTDFTGTFQGNPFNGSGDVGQTGGPTQQEFDARLAQIQNNMTYVQELNPAAEPDFETDKEAVLIFDGTQGGGNATGDDTATVFPDDQPNNFQEGRLTVSFGGTTQANIIIDLNVEADPDAPVVTKLSAAGGQVDGNWVVLDSSPTLSGEFNFPGGDPSPVDGTTVDLQLVNLTTNQVVQEFDFVADNPDANGEFGVSPSAGGYSYTARVSPGLLTAGELYAIRVLSPPLEHPSSVNKPVGEFFTGGTEAVINADTNVLPSDSLRVNDTKIAIVLADPQIRRNPSVTVDVINGNINPVFPGGFDDLLKETGDQFPMSVVNNSEVYPVANVIAGNDPTQIAPEDAQNPAINVSEVNPNRIVIDIAALIAADPTQTRTFSYRVFNKPTVAGQNATRTVLSEGTFTINADPGPAPAAVVGTDFGVNIFDDEITGPRELADLNPLFFTDKTLDIARLPASEGAASNDTEALFVQFNGGFLQVIESGLTNPAGFTAQGVSVVLRRQLDTDEAGPYPVDVRISGVGQNDIDYIGFIHLTQLDAEGQAGNLIDGQLYDVVLRDPTQGATDDYVYALPLLVEDSSN